MDALLDGVLRHLRTEVYGEEYWPAELDVQLRSAACLDDAARGRGAMLRRTTFWLVTLARETSVQALVEGTQTADGGAQFRRWLPLLKLETGRLFWGSSWSPENSRDLCQGYVDRVRSVWLSSDTASMDAAAPGARELARTGMLPKDDRPPDPLPCTLAPPRNAEDDDEYLEQSQQPPPSEDVAGDEFLANFDDWTGGF